MNNMGVRYKISARADGGPRGCPPIRFLIPVTRAQREREKMPLIVDTWFHVSARKQLGPISA